MTAIALTVLVLWGLSMYTLRRCQRQNKPMLTLVIGPPSVGKTSLIKALGLPNALEVTLTLDGSSSQGTPGTQRLTGMIIVLSAPSLLAMATSMRHYLAKKLHHCVVLVNRQMKHKLPVYIVINKVDLLKSAEDFIELLPNRKKHCSLKLSWPVKDNLDQLYDYFSQQRIMVLRHTKSEKIKAYLFPKFFHHAGKSIEDFFSMLVEEDHTQNIANYQHVYFMSAKQNYFIDDTLKKLLEEKKEHWFAHDYFILQRACWWLVMVANGLLLVMTSKTAFTYYFYYKPEQQKIYQLAQQVVADENSSAELVLLIKHSLALQENLKKIAKKQHVKIITNIAQMRLKNVFQQQVMAFYYHELQNKYPFGKQHEQATLESVKQFFHPVHGVLWTFLREELSGMIDDETGRWVPKAWLQKTGMIEDEFLATLNKAWLFSQATFPKAPSSRSPLVFSLYPQTHPLISELSFELSGQVLHYYNGPQQWQTFSWYSDAEPCLATLSVKAISGEKISRIEYGPWALFKLLQQAKYEKQGEDYIFSWELQGAKKDDIYKPSVKLRFEDVAHGGWFDKMLALS